MCIDLHQTGSVGEDSDHLQMIEFGQSCAPGNGGLRRAKHSARSVCVSVGAFFINVCVCNFVDVLSGED